MTATVSSNEVSPDELEMIRPILIDPNDDGPRLVFADWVEERGDHSRAEFIRESIELAQTPVHKIFGDTKLTIPNSRHLELMRSVQEYIGVLSSEWNGAFFFGDIELKWSRGWPYSVSIPMIRLMGGTCDGARCDRGQIYVGQDNLRWIPCLKCKGTGRTPALADTLAKLWPVTEIRLVDREPEYYGWRYRDWTWWNIAGNSGLFNLPKELWNRLTGFKVDSVLKRDAEDRSFPDRDSAKLALSRACVDESRSRAGLPGLKWKGTS